MIAVAVIAAVVLIAAVLALRAGPAARGQDMIDRTQARPEACEDGPVTVEDIED